MPIIRLDGARVHYTDSGGEGRPVIFLHGGFGSSSELWQRTIDALPPGYRGLAIDNFLRSDAPPDGFTIEALARRVAAFIDRLELERPVVVGHSMGGVVTQMTAVRYQEKLGGIVLVCTGPSMTNHALGRALLAQLENDGIETMREISAHWFRELPQPFFDGYVERAKAAPLTAMIDIQSSLIETDMRPHLPGVQLPALVVWGAHDSGRTMEHAQRLLDGLPNSTLAAMTDSGHSPMLETPAVFDEAFHAFLKSIPEFAQ
ncbi:alpha/beta hydrolase [Caballeronia sp. LZ043]|uniref:alpha/beta fold hydrolase n=1 Tax=Caballeronia sp. LZ043 TaxID=3038569 RepID=UPI00285AA748|nr:alpha/beta hydrolase [Caballeronia sp. LZ043]MDR5822110.1 alpha/beta hydrolase [Caballeronia sp. LZ043]